MSKSLPSYLYIGQSQRRSIIIALCLILLYGLFRNIYIHKNSGYFESAYANHPAESSPKGRSHNPKPDIDLNLATDNQLVDLGLPPHLAKRMIRFRDKIDGFKNWEKVSKVYGLTEQQLSLLKACTFIPQEYDSAKEIRKPVLTTSKKSTIVPVRVRIKSFDPNEVSAETLKLLGLKKNVINGLINFRKSGFRYRRKEDLLKIYTMDDASYKKIEPYIYFEQQPEKKFENDIKAKVIRPVDINKATMESLMELPGIGKYYAGQILRWRERLGGFTCQEQVRSTYHIPDSVFSKISAYIRFDTPPHKININTADIVSLAKHYYIHKKEAVIIVRYRDHHGPYKKIEDLLNTGAIDRDWLNKAGPYLSVADE